MSLKRTSALLATVIVAGLGLTACQGDDKPATAAPSTPAAAASSAATPAAPASTPAATTPAAAKPTTPAAVPTLPGGAVPSLPGGVVAGGTTKPADLPADLPLPEGKLTDVKGAPGAYVLTFAAADPKAAVTAYEAALKAAGFDVTSVGGQSGGVAEKGDINLLYGTLPTAVTVTYAKG